jgi:hypothetical protein
MPETLWGPTQDATVVLDVGGDVGALVLYTPAALLGAEIEISPVTDPTARSHTAVRARVLPDRTLYAAVYPALSAGEHVLWASAEHAAGPVVVVGGRVTEIDWLSLPGDHGHADHGHADHGHADHGHADHGHADHGHADHGHADHHHLEETPC